MAEMPSVSGIGGNGDPVRWRSTLRDEVAVGLMVVDVAGISAVVGIAR